jgi:hypothetical protein
MSLPLLPQREERSRPAGVASDRLDSLRREQHLFFYQPDYVGTGNVRVFRDGLPKETWRYVPVLTFLGDNGHSLPVIACDRTDT